MTIATVTLVGEDDLARAIGFLRLGAVVVIAPDDEALAAWMHDRWAGGHGDAAGAVVVDDGVVTRLHVDHRGHCVRWGDRRLPLTELEFRVLGCLLAEPGRAWSYRELREAGWGPVPDLGDDPYVVRSVVQRVRRKLADAAVPARIEPVRGFGLRLVDADAAPVALVRRGAAAGPA